MIRAKNQTTETPTADTIVPAEGKKGTLYTDAYYEELRAQKIAAGLSAEDAATVVKWQREEDEKATIKKESKA